MNEERSQFGKGLAYCLGLFLYHSAQLVRDIEIKERLKDKLSENSYNNYSTWFRGSTDHLYELQIESAPEHLRERLKIFKDKCLAWKELGSGSTKKDVLWSLAEAIELLRLLDEANGVNTIKGEYE